MGKKEICQDSTASLVMKWAGKLYKKGAPKRFMEKVDLSAGEGIYKACAEACPWYGEVILNRKYMIKRLIEEELSLYPARFR